MNNSNLNVYLEWDINSDNIITLKKGTYLFAVEAPRGDSCSYANGGYGGASYALVKVLNTCDFKINYLSITLGSNTVISAKSGRDYNWSRTTISTTTDTATYNGSNWDKTSLSVTFTAPSSLGSYQEYRYWARPYISGYYTSGTSFGESWGGSAYVSGYKTIDLNESKTALCTISSTHYRSSTESGVFGYIGGYGTTLSEIASCTFEWYARIFGINYSDGYDASIGTVGNSTSDYTIISYKLYYGDEVKSINQKSYILSVPENTVLP